MSRDKQPGADDIVGMLSAVIAQADYLEARLIALLNEGTGEVEGTAPAE